ncbi:hypothetical protein [Paenibacillus sp. OV219]|uniref:hypothetical protein n=1 Tax=Paenibacillus sp. OV219 TaxID=1884377 RepID=UPI0008AEBE27|nr:hypothetical protein [Paenibacillus sp. OV219]SEM80054.1 hypothetical protein SAMN05518847_101834 [Paenibacillus sp. OV219]
MKWDEGQAESLRSKLFTRDGKPLRILSTSLGLALIANAAFGAMVFAEGTTGAEQPKLVEFSNEAVKQYFDPAVDWNLPMLQDENAEEQSDDTATGSGGSGGVVSGGGGGTSSSGDTIIINNGSHSSFGWDDLMLYHLLFNQGSSYSTSRYYTTHSTYTSSTHQPYKPKTSYSSDSFQNKPVTGSSVRPVTSNKSGSVTRRSKSTSSSPGGIGGKSSSMSSSSSSSSSSKSSSHSIFGGFGG